MEVFRKLKDNILRHIEKRTVIKPEVIYFKDLTPNYLDALTHRAPLTQINTDLLLNDVNLFKQIRKYNTNPSIFIKNVARLYEQMPRMIIYTLSDHHMMYQCTKTPLVTLISKICLKYLERDEVARSKLFFVNKKFNFVKTTGEKEAILLKNIVTKLVGLSILKHKEQICILLFPSYDSISDQRGMIPIIDNLELIHVPEEYNIDKEYNIDILNMTEDQENNFNSIFFKTYRNSTEFINTETTPPLITYNSANSPFPIPLFTIPVVYCDGVYDLFHYGHSRLLLQAKELFPCVKLIVGVTSDQDTLYHKGITAMNAKDRAESIRHCKYVDSVIANCPWILTEEYLKLHNIWYVVHDDEPYAVKPIQNTEPQRKKVKIENDDSADCYLFLKTSMRFVSSNRTPGISTSGLIRKLLVNYENFLERNVNRGMTAKELNISAFKFNFIKFKSLLIEKIDDVKKDFRGIKRECAGAMHLWEEYKDLIRLKFLRLLEDIWTFDDEDYHVW